MSLFCCNNKCSCTLTAVVLSVIAGVITAFLQITGAITVTPVFLWVALGIAAVYLAILVATTEPYRRCEEDTCLCTALKTLLVGILGALLVAAILLAVGITATSVVSAILVGLLALFLALTATASACYVLTLANCTD